MTKRAINAFTYKSRKEAEQTISDAYLWDSCEAWYNNGFWWIVYKD